MERRVYASRKNPSKRTEKEWEAGPLTNEIIFPSVLEDLDVGRNLFACPCLLGLLEDVCSNQLIPA